MTIDLGHQPYYSVGDRAYRSKLMALIEGTRTNTHPQWHFGDEVFGKVLWDQGKTENIMPFYHRRARQLREKYDYLIIAYSGGADSRTLLEAFLDQGLIPDEILVSWPIKATEGKYQVSTDTSTGANILSEWDLIIKDDLAFLARNYPQITITVSDFSEDIVGDRAEFFDDDWYNINDHLNPVVYRKFTAMSQQERDVIDAGKRSALVWGVDKPQVAYRDGHLWLYFLDKTANTRSSDESNGRTSELFYWTADMPELVHAQARLVYDRFVANPQFLRLIDWQDRTVDPIAKKNQLNLFMKSIVYPTWNPLRFQAHKPTSMVWQEPDTWLFTHYSHTRYFKAWRSGLKNVMSAVDSKYYQYGANGRWEGWVGFISKFYDLGPIQLPQSSIEVAR